MHISVYVYAGQRPGSFHVHTPAVKREVAHAEAPMQEKRSVGVCVGRGEKREKGKRNRAAAIVMSKWRESSISGCRVLCYRTHFVSPFPRSLLPPPPRTTPSLLVSTGAAAAAAPSAASPGRG